MVAYPKRTGRACNGWMLGGRSGLWPEVGATLPFSRLQTPSRGRTTGLATTGNTLERNPRLLCYESGKNPYVGGFAPLVRNAEFGVEGNHDISAAEHFSTPFLPPQRPCPIVDVPLSFVCTAEKR